MPAFLTHLIGAEEIKKRLSNERIKNIINNNNNAYHSGAQGGDSFSHYKYYSMWIGYTYKIFGYALHRLRPQRFFVEGAEYVKNKSSDLLKSFFFGYITHYCFDYILHPLVIKKAPKMLSTHNTLEYAIDTIYAHEYGIDAATYDIAAFVIDTLVPGDEINDFYFEMFGKLFYGFKISPQIYTTAYKYYADFYKKMHMPDKRRMRIIKLQNIFTMLNLKSIIYKPYEEVKDKYDYKPFLELIEKAINRSVYLINIVDAYFNDEHDKTILESVFYNVNFSGDVLTPIEEQRFFRKAYKKARLKLF